MSGSMRLGTGFPPLMESIGTLRAGEGRGYTEKFLRFRNHFRIVRKSRHHYLLSRGGLRPLYSYGLLGRDDDGDTSFRTQHAAVEDQV